MTKRSLYALGFMIPGIFSPLPGVSATTPTVSPLPPPPSMSVYLSPEADDHNGVNDTVYQMLTRPGKPKGFAEEKRNGHGNFASLWSSAPVSSTTRIFFHR